MGLVIDKRKIELDEPIHELGNYEITIRFTKDIMPRIKLMVVGEEDKVKAEEGDEKKTRVKKTRVKKKVGAEEGSEKKEKKTGAKKKVKAEKEEKTEEAKEEKKEEKKEETK